MTILHFSFFRASMVLAILLFVGFFSTPVQAIETVSYSEDISPIIQIRCLSCHQPQGDGYEKSGLDLRTYEGLMKGTKFGPMVIPGDAFVSNLMVLIDGRANSSVRMPHGKKKLTSCDKDLFRWWINQGALDN